MNDTDVLVKYASILEWAAKQPKPNPTAIVFTEICAEALRDLAAGVRALRERAAKLEADLAYYETHYEECRKDMLAWMRKADELQTRVKELGPDAMLGRMVREMPKEHHLIHTVYGTWWFGRNVQGEFGKSGDTPQDALGRVGARCGDCTLRVGSGPLAGECHFDPDPRPENVACEYFEARAG